MKDLLTGVITGFLVGAAVFILMIINGLVMWLCYPAAVEVMPILSKIFNDGTFKQWVLFSWFVASLAGCLRVACGVKADNGGKK